mmetsp:Transcript_21165/g.49258  ORF Transcript_21165/g.49258 Transcript_21165/m.49258 type:complete len:243 (-) Transcript_21165:397-1125(-)
MPLRAADTGYVVGHEDFREVEVAKALLHGGSALVQLRFRLQVETAKVGPQLCTVGAQGGLPKSQRTFRIKLQKLGHHKNISVSVAKRSQVPHNVKAGRVGHQQRWGDSLPKFQVCALHEGGVRVEPLDKWVRRQCLGEVDSAIAGPIRTIHLVVTPLQSKLRGLLHTELQLLEERSFLRPGMFRRLPSHCPAEVGLPNGVRTTQNLQRLGQLRLQATPEARRRAGLWRRLHLAARSRQHRRR